jgi:hypothetical protein
MNKTKSGFQIAKRTVVGICYRDQQIILCAKDNLRRREVSATIRNDEVKMKRLIRGSGRETRPGFLCDLDDGGMVRLDSQQKAEWKDICPERKGGGRIRVNSSAGARS